MDPNLAWPWSIDGDSAAQSVEIPGWAAVETGGVILRMKARVVIGRRREVDQDRMPPQLIISHFRFRRNNSSSSGVDAAEDAHFTFTFREGYYYINSQPALWREQTQRMISRVAANHVHPDDVDHLAHAFHLYTYAVVHRFPIPDLVSMEFLSVVEIPINPSASASDLRYVFSPETSEYLYGIRDDDDDDDVQFGRVSGSGAGPASEAAVERLQVVTAGEGSSCPICLNDFEAMSQVLAMPCGHPFHERCLTEWLKQSNSCPLCRFSLPAAAAAAADDE